MELRKEKAKRAGEQLGMGLKYGAAKVGTKKTKTLSKSGKGKGEGKRALKKGETPKKRASKGEKALGKRLPEVKQGDAMKGGEASAVHHHVIPEKPAVETAGSPLIEDARTEVVPLAQQPVPESAKAEPVQVSAELKAGLVEDKGEEENKGSPESPNIGTEVSKPAFAMGEEVGLREDVLKPVSPHVEEPTFPVQSPVESIQEESTGDKNSDLKPFPTQADGPERPNSVQRAEPVITVDTDVRDDLGRPETGLGEKEDAEAIEPSVESSGIATAVEPSTVPVEEADIKGGQIQASGSPDSDSYPVVPNLTVYGAKQELPMAAEGIHDPDSSQVISEEGNDAKSLRGDDIQEQSAVHAIQPEEKAGDRKNDGVNTAREELPSAIVSANEPEAVIRQEQEIRVSEKEKEPAKVVEQIVEPPVKKKKRTIPFHKMLEPEKDATIGIPIGRPVVKITAPSRKKVSSRVQGISGRAQGNGVSRVTLSTNGENAVIPVQSGRFLLDTVLREGKNTISVTVWDMEGYSATDSITVEVFPPKNSFELSIDEPAGELESPIAIVRGRVEDVTVDTVKLIVNGEFVETPVDDGYFEKTVFLKERENTLQAEAINSAGLTARSGELKVAVKNPMAPDILLHLLCEGHDMESHPKVTLRERPRLDDEKRSVSDVDVIEMMSANEGYWEKVFAVEEARDGAYTLKVLEGKATDCKLVVTLNSSKRKVRVFEKRVLEGEEWAVGRFLLPEGIFWDEDEWFSGRIEDKDSITKYKSPEGVTWKELKEGP